MNYGSNVLCIGVFILMELIQSKRGEGSLVSNIVLVAVGVVVFAAVFMYTVINTNKTGWDSGSTALWNVLPIVGIAGLMLVVLRSFGVF
jgi:hypothetical protein